MSNYRSFIFIKQSLKGLGRNPVSFCEGVGHFEHHRSDELNSFNHINIEMEIVWQHLMAKSISICLLLLSQELPNILLILIFVFAQSANIR